MVNSIIIDNDGLFEEVTYEAHDPDKLSKQEIIKLIQEAGSSWYGWSRIPYSCEIITQRTGED